MSQAEEVQWVEGLLLQMQQDVRDKGTRGGGTEERTPGAAGICASCGGKLSRMQKGC